MAFGKFGKYYPGGIDTRPEDLDLPSVIREEFEAFRDFADADRRLEFRTSLSNLRVRSDRQHLRFVLFNLLQNAVKYSPQGGEVRVTLSLRDGQPMLEVADDGIGIPPDEIEELFSPFYRATNVGDVPGTGMGLAIVKKSARLLGASVEVESNSGAGTIFRILLPG